MAAGTVETTAASPELIGAPVGIRLLNVDRLHRMGAVGVRALRGVSLAIAPGEFVAIVGPSGSGKSTLLTLLGGLDRPTHGRIELEGQDLGRLPDRALADYRLQRVGTIFQIFNLVATLSARENVALPMALAGVRRSERRARAERLLQVVGLGERAGFSPSRLSGGEQQRVAVARALANRPGLLLADEPTGNLDTAAGAGVMALIQDLHRAGATVVLVTHDPEIAALAQRVVTLRDGAVVSDTGAPEAELPAASADRPPLRLRLPEAIRLGVAGLRRRKLRTGLSAAGISIGIALIALIVSLASGIQGSLIGGFERSGQLHNVQVQQDFSDPTRYKPFDQAAVDRLGALEHVRLAYGLVNLTGTVEADGRAPMSAVLTSEPPVSQRAPTASSALSAGRFPTSDAADEVVIGQDMATRLGWSPRAAIGRTIVFRGLASGFVAAGQGLRPAENRPPLGLRVVGVGPAGFTQLPSMQAPWETTRRYWQEMATANRWQTDEYALIVLVADRAGATDAVRSEARAAGYNAQSAEDIIRQIQQVLLALGAGLSTFAAIALVVAALGIANTMYTAVLERTREIGILKALGARSADVRTMFVAEAAAIGLLGGLVGLAIAGLLGLAGNAIVGNLLRQQVAGLQLTVFQLTPLVALATLAGAAAVSGLAGLLPAIRASRLNPTLALRYE
jgi:macrolide transport system ATP-binding/permease protein